MIKLCQIRLPIKAFSLSKDPREGFQTFLLEVYHGEENALRKYVSIAGGSKSNLILIGHLLSTGIIQKSWSKH